jgi:DnaJ-class molecular chaperone
MITETKQIACEACFGTKQVVEMKSPGFGQKIPAPPICPVCNGTGVKPKTSSVTRRANHPGDFSTPCPAPSEKIF